MERREESKERRVERGEYREESRERRVKREE
jgi:hypothetical protein